MSGLRLGDRVLIQNDPLRVATIINVRLNKAGRILFEVENKATYPREELYPIKSEPKDGGLPNGKLVLVTGGAGYIGSVLVRALLKEGWKVLCLDNLRFGGHALLGVWGHPNFTFLRLDLTNFAQVDRLMDGIQCYGVIHLAAIVGDPACSREPELARSTNLDASAHLLHRSIQAGVSRFVFASTCSNYGRMADPSAYVDEDSELAPISLYAECKVEFEKALLASAGPESFAPTALRFATAYGISPRMRFDLTVNEFTRELARGRELVVYGEQFWRPYCHVADLSRAIKLVLGAQREKVAHRVFNVGGNEENYTKQMLIEHLTRHVPGGRVRYVSRQEDPRDYRVKFDRIRRQLGFRITRTVPQGMKEILDALRLGIIDDPDEARYSNLPLRNGVAV